jgi:hypothetical protein
VVDLDAVRSDCNAISKVLWPGGIPLDSPNTPADKDLVRKAVLIVHQHRLSEDWLWDSVEAVRNATADVKNRPAYLHACLENKAADAGDRLDRLLAQTNVPAELAKPKAK